MGRGAFLALLFCVAEGVAAAASAPVAPSRSFARFFAFDFGAVGVLQQGGGDSESGWISWSPALQFSPSFELKLMAGGTLFKSYLGNLFVAGDAELLAHFEVADPWFVELGGGTQYWTNLRGGFFPAVSLGAGMQTTSPFLGLIDRWTVLYTLTYISTNPTHELRVLFRIIWPSD